MIRVGLVGGTGKLGKDLLRLLFNQQDIVVGAVVASKTNPNLGKDAGILYDGRVSGVLICDQVLDTLEHCDLYIDCTSAEAMMSNYNSYSLALKPIIIASTGFSEEDINRLSRLALTVPVVYSPNFSSNVYKFLKVVKEAAAQFGFQADIDLFEYHHKFKKDQPSGTAVAIAQAIREAGINEEIQVHSVRAGNIIGEHSVLFTTPENDRIEVSHKVYSRDSFSNGVLDTIRWVVHQPHGLYEMKDVYEGT